jgi:hypothetical protein
MPQISFYDARGQLALDQVTDAQLEALTPEQREELAEVIRVAKMTKDADARLIAANVAVREATHQLTLAILADDKVNPPMTATAAIKAQLNAESIRKGHGPLREHNEKGELVPLPDKAATYEPVNGGPSTAHAKVAIVGPKKEAAKHRRECEEALQACRVELIAARQNAADWNTRNASSLAGWLKQFPAMTAEEARLASIANYKPSKGRVRRPTFSPLSAVLEGRPSNKSGRRDPRQVKTRMPMFDTNAVKKPALLDEDRRMGEGYQRPSVHRMNDDEG